MQERNNYRNILIGMLCILLLAVIFYFWFTSKDKKSLSATHTEKSDETSEAKRNSGKGKNNISRTFSGNADIPYSLSEDEEGIRPEDEIANRIFATGISSVFYADPLKWVQAGYIPKITNRDILIKAQAVNIHGYKMSGSFDYRTANEAGAMVLLNPEALVYQKTLTLGYGEHEYQIEYKGLTIGGRVIKEGYKCDYCHARPPGHIAEASKWGRCNTCHNLGVKVHMHAVKKAKISTENCQICHSAKQYEGDVHETKGFWCTNCHGSLKDVLRNKFRIPGQAGKPKCSDCHDREHGGTKNALYADSFGHGRILCINCHNVAHRITKPLNLGDRKNNNCSLCHTTQPERQGKGRDCGRCHASGWDPHLIKKSERLD